MLQTKVGFVNKNIPQRYIHFEEQVQFLELLQPRIAVDLVALLLWFEALKDPLFEDC